MIAFLLLACVPHDVRTRTQLTTTHDMIVMPPPVGLHSEGPPLETGEISVQGGLAAQSAATATRGRNRGAPGLAVAPLEAYGRIAGAIGHGVSLGATFGGSPRQKLARSALDLNLGLELSTGYRFVPDVSFTRRVGSVADRPVWLGWGGAAGVAMAPFQSVQTVDVTTEHTYGGETISESHSVSRDEVLGLAPVFTGGTGVQIGMDVDRTSFWVAGALEGYPVGRGYTKESQLCTSVDSGPWDCEGSDGSGAPYVRLHSLPSVHVGLAHRTGDVRVAARLLYTGRGSPNTGQWPLGGDISLAWIVGEPTLAPPRPRIDADAPADLDPW